jgi:hypothetical protein
VKHHLATPLFRLAERHIGAHPSSSAAPATMISAAPSHASDRPGGDPLNGSARPLDFGQWAAPKIELTRNHVCTARLSPSGLRSIRGIGSPACSPRRGDKEALLELLGFRPGTGAGA